LIAAASLLLIIFLRQIFTDVESCWQCP